MSARDVSAPDRSTTTATGWALLAGGFRTEFFIKTGLVLLGASINIAVIVSAAGPALA